MSLDIKTSVIKPKRHTYANVAERLGEDRPASRYEEATYDLEPTANFHYRPTWDPAHELFDESRTAIKMKDWYALLDPRQLYYGTYTIARNKMMEGADAQYSFVEGRRLLSKLTPRGRALTEKIILPLRHYEWGANMNNTEIARFGAGAAVTQAANFAGMDRLGLAQLISRIGLALDGVAPEDAEKSSVLHATGACWTQDEMWQPMRKVVEDTFVLQDWFELFVAQNFIMDGLVFKLAYDRIDGEIVNEGGDALSMMTEVLRVWAKDHERWVDAVMKRAVGESHENATQIAEWVNAWGKRVAAALQPIAREAFGEKSGEVISGLLGDFTKRIGKTGLQA